MLSKASVSARPSVLWCYKKELGFSSHRKKRMKSVQRKVQAGKLNVNEDDPFELFVASTNIRYTYYSETHKILGNTYGMCVLQDFEALTPNLLARTIETVEGGGVIVLLLRTLSSLKQLYTMSMDIHERYRTEAHSDVVCRFNERFLLSLSSCNRCLVVDDQLTVLPITSQHVLNITPVSKTSDLSQQEQELNALKTSLKDTQPVSALIDCCKTLDQAKALLKFIDGISEKTLRSTVSLTAARGRGKSAALGLAVAGAVAFGYSNIFVTSPSPENLNTFFQFIFKGFDALAYQEHLDYSIVQSTEPEYNKALVRVNIFRDHRQTIQYIHPTESQRLSQAELLVIDEAAAIPLNYVKALMGPYLVFLASTINGYEGTGRSLSLKLLQQLRTSALPMGVNSAQGNDIKTSGAATGRSLTEITLDESIRYKPGDAVEKWLTHLLCLDAACVQTLGAGCPSPDSCDLYYISRDTLFCYHKASESFLQRIVSLFVASHYKNSPNDLQMMSDAPAHHLFCLLGPVSPNTKALPEVYCVIQVCLEGQVSRNSVLDGLHRGSRAAGDLIPWTIAQQYQDEDFPALCGARVVRVATHPDYQGLDRAYEQIIYPLENFRKDHIGGVKLDRAYEQIIYPLENFRKDHIGGVKWLGPHCTAQPVNTKQKLKLATYQGRQIHIHINRDIFYMYSIDISALLSRSELNAHLTSYDIKRLEMYCNNLTDYHLIVDMLPTIARLYFLNKLGDTHLSPLQCAILIGLGLQYKTVDTLTKELDIQAQQLLGLFNRTMRRCLTVLSGVMEKSIEESLMMKDESEVTGAMRPVKISMNDELEQAAKELKVKQQQELQKLKNENLNGFAIKGSEQEWDQALSSGKKKSVISIKRVLDKELKVKQQQELQKLKNENLNGFAIKGSEQEWDQALSSGKKKSVISIKSGEKRPVEVIKSTMEDHLEKSASKKKKKSFKKNKK
ncbi:RNA cytidine acetyltransferase [Diaphorina citri]|uniref:RNA cytidine acetyltransferase n=1 Tax=Diaphorina citri TaxID=121845 RepID=A0A3Q0IPW8_DIACI|nr:RNA cytidine acetyltransferase [Diaphorina citri]